MRYAASRCKEVVSGLCVDIAPPTGGNTQVIEEKKGRLKLKKIPKLPDFSELSDAGIILLLVKVVDNFKPAFPPDGYGITENHSSDTPSGRGYILFSDIQFDAYSAANKFSNIIFPLLIAISNRPSIKAMMAGQNPSDSDLMKFIYAFAAAGSTPTVGRLVRAGLAESRQLALALSCQRARRRTQRRPEHRLECRLGAFSWR